MADKFWDNSADKFVVKERGVALMGLLFRLMADKSWDNSADKFGVTEHELALSALLYYYTGTAILEMYLVLYKVFKIPSLTVHFPSGSLCCAW